MNILNALAVLTILLYFGAAALQTGRMLHKVQRGVLAVFVLSFCAVLLHAYLLHQWIDVEGGQNLTFFNTLSQVMWVATVLVWFMALRRPLVNLGIILYPLAGLSIILVMLFGGDYIINTGAHPKRLLHILLSFLAIGILIIAGTQALFLAILDKALLRKYSNPMIQSLPPLQMMESLLFQLIALGFCVLTLVILTGLGFYLTQFPSQLWQHLVLPIAAWVVFGILLIGRVRFGWRGTVAIRWTLLGLVLLLIGYMASHFWSF